MDNLLNTLETIKGMKNPISVLQAGQVGMEQMVAAIITGLILCFLGLKIVRVLVALIGFGIGTGIGITIVNQTGTTGFTNVIIIFGCGIVLAVLSFFIYRAGVFLTTFSIVGAGSMLMIDMGTESQLIIALVITLVLSILAAVFVEPVIILITAISGGMSAGWNIVSIAGWADNPWIGVGAGAVLAVLGMIVQFMMQSRKVGKRERIYANEVKEADSMETEVEKARMLLDDDTEEETDSKRNAAFGDDIEIIEDLDDDTED